MDRLTKTIRAELTFMDRCFRNSLKGLIPSCKKVRAVRSPHGLTSQSIAVVVSLYRTVHTVTNRRTLACTHTHACVCLRVLVCLCLFTCACLLVHTHKHKQAHANKHMHMQNAIATAQFKTGHVYLYRPMNQFLTCWHQMPETKQGTLTEFGVCLHF